MDRVASSICCGLTASTTTLARLAACALSELVRTPKRFPMSSVFALTLSVAQIVAGAAPFATSPPIRLDAMLPLPMNAMSCW